ncbi:MAG: hypothetical protein KDC05_10570 [Bacteroidales bacterium]|nr:hypothetical protein [Bacteroidales bacterium]
MKEKIFITMMILISAYGYGQSSFPQEIQQGQTETVRAADVSLWVITDSQMDSVLVKGELLEICLEESRELKNKITNLEKIKAEQVEIIDTLKAGYGHYVEMWKECDYTLEEKEKEVVKQRRMHKWFAGGGLAVGFLVALLIL